MCFFMQPNGNLKRSLYFHFKLQKMNHNQALATVALLIFYMIYLTDGARYVPKWKKQACEVPASQNEQSHYTCDDNGDVKCLPGKLNELIKNCIFEK